METVVQLHSFLRSLYEVEEPTTDHIVHGDPNAKLVRVGTCWLAYISTIERAAQLGIRTLVVHEPLFYSHNDLSPINTSCGTGTEAREQYHRQAQVKRDLLDRYRITVIRCHDVPDSLPDFGIPFAWGRQLGFDASSIIRSKRYFNVYSISPTPAAQVAAQIAAHVKDLNQPGVAFWGDPDRIVRSVGVGTGCYSSPTAYMELGAEMYVAIDDTIRNWIETPFALDTGLPLAVVNHGTSEEAGVRELSSFLREKLAPIEVIHLPQGCSYQWFS